MAAVIESAVDGIPSVGFSLSDYSSKADFSACRSFLPKIINGVLNQGLPDGVCLNVNIPAVKEKDIRGIKICRQARASWVEDFDERKDPNGHDYYWLKGIFVKIDNGEDTDEWAIENNYISILPVQFDFTAYQWIDHFKKWTFNENT